jgi:hypothetical protein
MSTYTEVQTEFKSIEDLQAALAECGLEYQVYPECDGIYRKWSRRGTGKNEYGSVRGRDAALVIHGGIDTTPRRYCGDTAFVWEGDTLRAKRDIAHGNAPQNWERIKNEYAYAGLSRQARRAGLRLERQRNEDGTIQVKAYRQSKSVMRRLRAQRGA